MTPTMTSTMTCAMTQAMTMFLTLTHTMTHAVTLNKTLGGCVKLPQDGRRCLDPWTEFQPFLIAWKLEVTYDGQRLGKDNR